MKLLIVTRIPQRAGGRLLETKKTVVADWIRVGRNASCEIHLPDPRIPLEKGMIVDRNGLVYLEGEGGSQNITRKAVRAVRLKPGEPLEIGPYRLRSVPAPKGYDGAIEVELLRAPEITTDLASRTAQRTLASLKIPKRAAAWTLVAIVAVTCLAIPAGRVLDLPWRAASQHLAIGDRSWNPGAVMLAHQPIETRCGACHEVAFERVKNGACLACHAGTGHHLGATLQRASLFDGTRCASCHREHKGTKATHRDDDRFCIDCHRGLAPGSAAQGAMNASDFASAHPAFRLTIHEANATQRVRQGAQPVTQRSNLLFPHATHLDPKGVRAPAKGRLKLDCASCHTPDASGQSFEPISMAKHCQECHRLEFEPAVTTREVPHGKPAEAVTVIEEFYASLALKGERDSFQKAFGVPGTGLLRRLGAENENARQEALRLANGKAKEVATELFEVRVCNTCHEVSRSPAGAGAGSSAWEIAPVSGMHRWMPHARFDHKMHAQSRCVSCHHVADSLRSSDVAMPTIETCRDCHGGSKPAEKKITSNCILCHGFHDAAHPWDATPMPARVARVEPHGR